MQRLLHKMKHLDGLTKLPLFVIGRLTYGYGNVKYAYYGLDIYSNDANYTIGLFAKLLQDLKLLLKLSIQQLFVNSQSIALYEALLHGAEACKSSLPPPLEQFLFTMPLLPILNMQMDNAMSHNKNRFVFCF